MQISCVASAKVIGFLNKYFIMMHWFALIVAGSFAHSLINGKREHVGKILIYCSLLFSFFALQAKIYIDFKIDENYLIAHTLEKKAFSSERERESIQAFRKEVEEKHLIGYQFFEGCHGIASPQISNHPFLCDFMDFAKSLETFQPIFLQTQAYKLRCEILWENTYDRVSQYVREITGLDFDENFEVFFTHPSLRNGWYIGNHQIAWGCSGEFEYYDVVYLWHEILHSYFPLDDISHCLIQLIADNGIRLLLNEKEQLFPLIGHKDSLPLMEVIYPKWEEYLKQPDRNIFQFFNELKASLVSCE